MLQHHVLVATLPPLSGEPPLVSGLTTKERAPALIVKASFSYAGGRLSPASEPATLHASDFVPPKADAEVIAKGRAAATSAGASVDVDGIACAVTAEGSLAPEDGLPLIMPGAHVTLTGLSKHAHTIAFDLPDLSPRASVERRGRSLRAVDLVCDTLAIDADREILDLTWRGTLSISDAESADQLLLFWSHAAAPRSADDAREHLARASFSYPLEERDLEGGPHLDPLEEGALLAARADAFGLPAKPWLPIAQYAAIAAELSEKREPSPHVLRRHGLTEEAWMVEERAWLEAMAEGANQGDLLVAGRFGEAFVAAQDALAGPDEAARTADDWVPIKARLSRGADPAKALPEAGMTLPVWMRLDRRIAAGARRDPALAADLDARVAAAAAALGEIEDDPIDVPIGDEEA